MQIRYTVFTKYHWKKIWILKMDLNMAMVSGVNFPWQAQHIWINNILGTVFPDSVVGKITLIMRMERTEHYSSLSGRGLFNLLHTLLRVTRTSIKIWTLLLLMNGCSSIIVIHMTKVFYIFVFSPRSSLRILNKLELRIIFNFHTC